MKRFTNWFQSLGTKMQSFMYGRYGVDELSLFLSKAMLVSLIAGLFVLPEFFMAVTMALWLWMIFRTCSRNIAKRQRERGAYLRMTKPFRDGTSLQKRKFSDRKTYRYYKCRQCKAPLRVPKGKGKIKIHCPKCGVEMLKKT